MTLSSILPLAGAAFAPVLGKVIEGVADGLTFLDVLHEQEQAGATDDATDADSSTMQHDLAELGDRLRERFARLGIDLSTPLRLKQDGRGRIVVDSDHPDRVLVESIFRDDAELTNLFHEVADAAALERAEADSGVTKEFHLVVGQAGAVIEFA